MMGGGVFPGMFGGGPGGSPVNVFEAGKGGGSMLDGGGGSGGSGNSSNTPNIGSAPTPTMPDAAVLMGMMVSGYHTHTVCVWVCVCMCVLVCVSELAIICERVCVCAIVQMAMRAVGEAGLLILASRDF